MKLRSLIICNYKNYCGEQTFEFNSSTPEKNITLIGGHNGAGKTTLFEAVKLCMFGYQYDGQPISNTRYEAYIRSCRNKLSISEGDNRYFISMDVILDDVQPIYAITLKRIWEITDDSFKEEFVILREGHAFEIVERENWQQYIYDLFPPYTIDYFFFDGEKMKDLVVGDKAENILRESARDLIGLKIYDTLLTDIGILKNKIRKSTTKDQKSQDEYERLVGEVKNNKNMLASLEKETTNLNALISISDTKINEIREDIYRKAGAFAKVHDQYKNQIDTIEARIAELNIDIAKMCDYVPFIMAFTLMNEALNQLYKERALREVTNDKDVVEKIREHLSEKLEVDKKTLKRVNQILDEFSESIDNTTPTTIIHDVNNTTLNHFSEFQLAIKKERKQKFLELLRERETLDIKLQKLLIAQKQMPESVYVADEVAEIEELKAKIQISQSRVGAISENVILLTKTYENNLARINEIDSASLKLVEDKSKYAVCEKLEAVLQDYIGYTLTTKVKVLEETISSMYKKLENKDDMVEHLNLNPSTFALTLYGFDGKAINKDTLSAGEKEILALSILWGLSKLSKHHLPIVVDSLLARLDQSHVSKVATLFLPNAGEQVLILSHNREVNRDMRTQLLPFISDEYLLSYDQKKKVSRGYFKECS
ncbi:MAG: DNA sulfur modification protein DndD [Tissierellia bacterium]|nr:DNA sulfur modification protein DndD [Tissierellia bacterium]